MFSGALRDSALRDSRPTLKQLQSNDSMTCSHWWCSSSPDVSPEVFSADGPPLQLSQHQVVRDRAESQVVGLVVELSGGGEAVTPTITVGSAAVADVAACGTDVGGAG